MPYSENGSVNGSIQSAYRFKFFAGRNRVTFKRIGLYLECGLFAVIRNQESTLQFLGNHSKLLSICQGLWTILSKVGKNKGEKTSN